MWSSPAEVFESAWLTSQGVDLETRDRRRWSVGEYYQRKADLEIGKPTTMRDTVDAMLSFDKVVTP